MKKVLLMAVAAGFLVACNKNSGYTLSGELTGFTDGTKVYLSKIEEQDLVKIDSTEIKDGKFSFAGEVAEVEYSFIEINEVPQPLQIPFILENGEIKLVADKNDLQNSKVTGTKNNDDLMKFNEVSYQIGKEIEEFQQANMQKFQEASMNNDQATIESLMQEMEAKQNKLFDEAKNYISNNKDSYVSVLLLAQIGANLETKELSEKFHALSTPVKETKLGKEIAERLKTSEATEVGKIAPDFSAPDLEGKQLSLHENLGKVTIIDFWASWCGPCRQENPNVVKLYNQYKDKGLQIIGVSLDREDEKWRKAIVDDQLTWLHVSNLKFWQDPIAKTYNVTAIPATFILDEKGTIVAKDLRGEELEAKIAELLN